MNGYYSLLSALFRFSSPNRAHVECRFIYKVNFLWPMRASRKQLVSLHAASLSKRIFKSYWFMANGFPVSSPLSFLHCGERSYRCGWSKWMMQIVWWIFCIIIFPESIKIVFGTCLTWSQPVQKSIQMHRSTSGPNELCSENSFDVQGICFDWRLVLFRPLFGGSISEYQTGRALSLIDARISENWIGTVAKGSGWLA